MPVTFEEKQGILEALSLLKRVQKVQEIIKNQIDIINLEKDINNKVKKRIENKQKQFYLNEKLKVVEEELGVSDHVKVLWEKIKKSKYPPEILSKIKTELGKLETTSSNSVDFMINYNYVECLVNLPWYRFTKKAINIQKAKEQLNSSHYGLGKVKERLLEFISVQILSSERTEGGALCLVGPSWDWQNQPGEINSGFAR